MNLRTVFLWAFLFVDRKFGERLNLRLLQPVFLKKFIEIDY